MKIDRLLSIIITLINRPMVTAKDLSEKYEVSVRTIYRDMESISMAGIPIVAYQGKKGGFCLMENYRIDRQILGLEDIVSIITALKGIHSTFTTTEIENTIDKMESLIPPDKRYLVQQRFEHIIIDLTSWDWSKVQKDTLHTINRALTHSQLLRFEYRNLRGEVSKRTVEPHALWLKTYCWYLYAFCRKRQDYRLFRLSRIRQCELLDEHYIRRDHNLNTKDFFGRDNRPPVNLRLKFSPEAVNKVEEYFGGCPKEQTPEGGRIVEVAFPEDEWVYSMLLGFGEHVEVLTPSHIRNIVKERIRKMYYCYDL